MNGNIKIIIIILALVALVYMFWDKIFPPASVLVDGSGNYQNENGVPTDVNGVPLTAAQIALRDKQQADYDKTHPIDGNGQVNTSRINVPYGAKSGTDKIVFNAFVDAFTARWGQRMDGGSYNGYNASYYLQQGEHYLIWDKNFDKINHPNYLTLYYDWQRFKTDF